MTDSSFNPHPPLPEPPQKRVLPHLMSPLKTENEPLAILQRLKMVSHDLEALRLCEKASKEELFQKTFLLNHVLESIHQGLLFVDKEGSILLCNSLAEKYLQKENGDILKKSFFELFPDRFFGFSLRAALFYGTNPPQTRMMLSPTLEIELSCLAVSYPEPVEGLFLFLKEIPSISEKKGKENQRFYELGKMTAHLSHDMRNQLGGIRGFSALLIQDLEDMPYLYEMARQILETTKQLEYTLSSALNFSKEIYLSLSLIDLSVFLRELIDFFKEDPACPEFVEFDLHLPYAQVVTLIDACYLKSALLNLLLNAIEAMDKKGKITLSLLKQNDELLITLSDNGKGMSQLQMEKIFSPFFTTKEKGNGLGLSQVKKIIQAHEGRIEVYSQEKMGTSFSLYLPIKQEMKDETGKNPHR